MGWTVSRTKQALADCGAVEAELDADLAGRRPIIRRSTWSSRGWQCCPVSTHDHGLEAARLVPSEHVCGGVRQRRQRRPEPLGGRAWVGAWAQTKDGTVHTHYFERVAAARRREIDQRINELKSWIGDARFTVRFPGDIHARLLGTRTVPGPASRRSDRAKEQKA